jgi:GTP-binding protein
VKVGQAEPFVVADIPGLIEGAHRGAGLGDRFLRHIERNRILVHLVDASAIEPDDPLRAYKTVNAEMVKYSPALAQMPQIVALNKMDLSGAETAAEKFEEAAAGLPLFRISAVTGQGVEELLNSIVTRLEHLDKDE